MIEHGTTTTIPQGQLRIVPPWEAVIPAHFYSSQKEVESKIGFQAWLIARHPKFGRPHVLGSGAIPLLHDLFESAFRESSIQSTDPSGCMVAYLGHGKKRLGLAATNRHFPDQTYQAELSGNSVHGEAVWKEALANMDGALNSGAIPFVIGDNAFVVSLVMSMSSPDGDFSVGLTREFKRSCSLVQKAGA